MTPRELATLVGVSPDTLRHYEAKGLLPAPPRTAAGYRQYPPDALPRVRLIRRALAVGFSIADLARVLRERDRGGAPCRSVRALVGARMDDLDRQVRDLQALKRDLRALIRDWDARLAQTPPGARAHLLESMADRPRPLASAVRPARAVRRAASGSSV